MKNILFFWIPKNGGWTINEMLNVNGGIKYNTPETIYNFKNKGIATFGHINTDSLIKRGIISKDFFNSAFKFAFVRNPYDRAVSVYTQLIRSEKINKDISFKDTFCQPIEPISILHDYKNNIANSQSSWIIRNNHPIVDFVGRFENFENDVKKLFDKLNLKYSDVPHCNQSPTDNCYTYDIKKHWQDYYDNETKAIIYNLYRMDFENFNYSTKL